MGLRIADCGLRIDKTFNLDFALAVEQTHKSAIRNPQSAIRNLHSLLPMRITFLGTGTSVGVPMIGCECEVCRSDDPRDMRLRTGLMVETAIEDGGRRMVIDVSADFRQQALREKIDRLDALLITHCHADHV